MATEARDSQRVTRNPQHEPINQFESIMQNKPNFRKTKMNLNSYLTKVYENERLADAGKTKPKQTQYKANTNPIPERPKMNENLFATKVYENITTFGLRQNKPNTNPIKPDTLLLCGALLRACPEHS